VVANFLTTKLAALLAFSEKMGITNPRPNGGDCKSSPAFATIWAYPEEHGLVTVYKADENKVIRIAMIIYLLLELIRRVYCKGKTAFSNF
jgi:hypothetical protein